MRLILTLRGVPEHEREDVVNWNDLAKEALQGGGSVQLTVTGSNLTVVQAEFDVSAIDLEIK